MTSALLLNKEYLIRVPPPPTTTGIHAGQKHLCGAQGSGTRHQGTQETCSDPSMRKEAYRPHCGPCTGHGQLQPLSHSLGTPRKNCLKQSLMNKSCYGSPDFQQRSSSTPLEKKIPVWTHWRA